MRLIQKIPRFGRVILILLVFVGIVLALGSMYQIIATRADLEAHPAPGRMVDVAGMKYHLNCLGSGSPTVILEAGLGESSLSWIPVQRKIAQSTRVCAYDRAGLGWSDWVNAQMSSAQVAQNLRALLQNAGVAAPYVLVGHSRGGVFVRSFYAQSPKDVRGMVLVDSTHENDPIRSLPYVGNYYQRQALQMNLGVFLARFGILRFTGLTDAARQHPPLSPDEILAKTAVQNRTDTALAFANEIFVMQREGLDPTTPQPASLGDLPLIVLTAGQGVDVDLARQKAERADEDGSVAIKLARLELKNQKELADLSTKSQHLIVQNSGHYILWDQPDVVVKAILEVVGEAQ
jgi:pimeloyl-ACP methyl ester carboxylesterase